jgi:hypothetical protein
MGDFNAPGFDWNCGLPQANSHYYSKLKGDAIFTSLCFLDLRQRMDAVGSSSLLDLVFTNFSDLRITSADSGIVKPDAYHPPLIIDILLPTATTARNGEYSYYKFASGFTLGYTTFFQLTTGPGCITAPLLTMLWPA